MKIRNLVLSLVAGTALAVSGCTGLGETIKAHVPVRDYQGKIVGQSMADAWGGVAKDYKNLRLVAIPNTVGAVMKTANDIAEMPVRSATTAAVIVTKHIPVLEDLSNGTDYLANTTFDSLPGGDDFNGSFARFKVGKSEETGVAGLLRNSYDQVEKRAELEKKPIYKQRVAVEGTYKTAVKLAGIAGIYELIFGK